MVQLYMDVWVPGCWSNPQMQSPWIGRADCTNHCICSGDFGIQGGSGNQSPTDTERQLYKNSYHVHKWEESKGNLRKGQEVRRKTSGSSRWVYSPCFCPFLSDGAIFSFLPCILLLGWPWVCSLTSLRLKFLPLLNGIDNINYLLEVLR